MHCLINVRENRRENKNGQSRYTILETQDTGRRQTKHNTENQSDEQHGPHIFIIFIFDMFETVR